MNKKIIAVLLALIVAAGSIAAALKLNASSAGILTFPDVKEGDWFYEPVTSLTELGIINGMPSGRFEPDGTLTHGEFLKMLACAFYTYAVPETEGQVMFTPDGPVSMTDWADPYLYAAVSLGVAAPDEGSGEEYLEAPISRYSVALLSVRTSEFVLGEKNVDSKQAAALMKDTVPDPYSYAVSQAYGKGIVGGYEDGTFRGRNSLTRAEAATVVYRLIYPEVRIDTGLEEFVPLQSKDKIIGRKAADGTAPESPPSEQDVIDASWFSDAVFIGDSLTDGLRNYSDLETADYLCSTGATVQDVLGRTPGYLDGKTIGDALGSKSYGKVFLMLGINQPNEDSDRYRDACNALLDEIEQLQPCATVYVQSVLPVTRSKDAGGLFTLSNIRRLNNILQDICLERGLVYVDMYAALADSYGYLPDSYSWDGIHLEANAYVLWIEKLTEMLQDMQ